MGDDRCGQGNAALGARALRATCWALPIVCSLSYGVALLPPGTRALPYIGLHLGLTLVMTVAYLASAQATTRELRALVIAGLLARLLLVFVPPFTTHDVQRYLWDGAALVAGLDPYVVTPDATAAASLRATWSTAPEHGPYPTLYPPVALALFAACSLGGPSAGAWLWKLVVALASCAALWTFWRLLQAQGRARHVALLAASPLVLLEGGVGAHVDVVAAMALVMGLLVYARGAPARAGALIGVAALLKLAPLLVMAPLAAYAATGGDEPWPKRLGRALPLLGGGAAALAAGYGVTLALGYEAVGSLTVFFAKWRFGSPLWWDVVLTSAARTEQLLRLAALAGALLLGLATLMALHRRLGLGVLIAVAAPFVASPVVFPWYLVGIASVVALAPTGWALAWLGALPLTYEVLDRFDAAGVWAPARWPLVVVGIAVLVGIAIDVVRTRLACIGHHPT